MTDAWQRQGLGTELLNAVANVASENSVAYFHAGVLADNYPMRALAQKVGCEVRINPEAHYLVGISRTIQSPNRASGVVIYQ